MSLACELLYSDPPKSRKNTRSFPTVFDSKIRDIENTRAKFQDIQNIEQIVKQSRDATQSLKTRGGRIENMLQEFRNPIYRKRNWGGENEKPVNGIILRIARDFMHRLPKNIDLPVLDLDPEGHVDLFWTKGNYDLIINFDENGRINFAFLALNNRKFSGQSMNYKVIPEELEIVMERYFGIF